MLDFGTNKMLKRYAMTTVSSLLAKSGALAILTVTGLTVPCLADDEANAYGDVKLHAVEQQIVSLAQASEKDISYQDHQKLLDKVSGEIVGSMSNVSDLATLAVWAYLNVHSNEMDGRFINYDHVVRTAFSSALCQIAKQTTPQAEAALWRVARQVNIDGHVSEELADAIGSVTKKKDFRFGERVYTRFQERTLEKLPLAPELAKFRIAVCDELWKHWKSPVKESADVIARATFVIDQDRQFTNIKVVPAYFGKTKDQAAGLQFVETARTALEHCALKEPLPSTLKKVRVEADFYGK